MLNREKLFNKGDKRFYLDGKDTFVLGFVMLKVILMTIKQPMCDFLLLHVHKIIMNKE